MKRLTVIVLTACLSLLAPVGLASAGTIIDEPFDANSLIESPLSYAMVRMDMMDMWMGGTTMAMGMGMWKLVDVDAGSMMYYVEGFVNNMGLGMAGAWSSLVYFVGKPSDGWGAPGVEFSFDYHTEDLPSGLVVKYGVYGWKGGEILNLGSEDPSGGGFGLIKGVVTDGSEWHTVGGSYEGDLAPFDFIGVTFTIGDMTDDGDPVSLDIDNIQLDAVPEPGSMLLWVGTMATVAYVRRRLHRHRRATGPPG